MFQQGTVALWCEIPVLPPYFLVPVNAGGWTRRPFGSLPPLGFYVHFFSSPGRCADLQVQFTDTVSTVADQKELIAKLEHDLSTIQSLSSVRRPDAEVSQRFRLFPAQAIDLDFWP